MAAGLSAIVFIAHNLRAEPDGRKPTVAARSPDAACCTTGAMSCASTACHGNGNQGAVAGTKGTEFATWLGGDPHARASLVLQSSLSKQIARSIGVANAATAPQCLVCHGSPVKESTGTPASYSNRDGVGCEACHGPAEKYLAEHFRPEWLGLPASEKNAAGMTPTKDLTYRARLCVSCHVGGEGQQVNHDMIAAGHPMLRFELSAYLAKYRGRHWNLAKDRASVPDFDVAAWNVGRREAQQASLRLLKSRAEDAAKHKAAWPEFSEFDCHSCHQALRPNLGSTSPSSEGRMRWGAWYFADFAGIESPSTALAGRLRQLLSAGGSPTDAASAADDAIRRFDSHAGNAPAAAVLLTLANPDAAKGDGWEQARARYLAILAGAESLRDRGAATNDASLAAALRKLDESCRNWKMFSRENFSSALEEVRKLLTPKP